MDSTFNNKLQYSLEKLCGHDYIQIRGTSKKQRQTQFEYFMDFQKIFRK